jgi:hypothetical protein
MYLKGTNITKLYHKGVSITTAFYKGIKILESLVSDITSFVISLFESRNFGDSIGDNFDNIISPGRCITSENQAAPWVDTYLYPSDSDNIITISVWLKQHYSHNTSNIRVIGSSFSSGDDRRLYFALRPDSFDDEPYLGFGDSYSGKGSSASWELNEWHCHQVVYNFTTGTAQWFVDGVLEHSVSGSWSTGVATESFKLMVLDESSLLQSPFRYYDFRVYVNQTLTAQDLQDIREFSSELTPQLHYTLESLGSNLINLPNIGSLGPTNDGIIQNATLSDFYIDDPTVPYSFHNERSHTKGVSISGGPMYLNDDAFIAGHTNTGNFTMEFWVRQPEETGGDVDRYICSKGAGYNTSNTGFRLYRPKWAGYKDYYFSMSSSSNVFRNASINGESAGTEWGEIDHIVISVDRSGSISFFVNGQNTTNTNISAYAGQSIHDAANFKLGAQQNDGNTWSSYILYAAFSDIARDVTYALARYNGDFSIDSNHKAVFDFRESKGIDKSGNNRHLNNTQNGTIETIPSEIIPPQLLNYTGRVKYNASLVKSNGLKTDTSMTGVWCRTNSEYGIINAAGYDPHIIVKFKYYDPENNTLQWFFDRRGNGATSDDKDWQLYTSNSSDYKKLNFGVYDSNTTIYKATSTVDLIDEHFYTIEAWYDRVGGKVVLSQTDETVGATYVFELDVASPITIAHTAHYIGLGMPAWHNTLYKSEAVHSYALLKDFVTGNKIIELVPSSGWGDKIYDVSGNDRHITMIGVTLSEVWAETQDHFHYNLNYGYSKYNNGSNDILIPYDANGNPIVDTPAGYTKVGDYSASATGHNGAETVLNFPKSPALVKRNNDEGSDFLFDSTSGYTPEDISYSDIVANVNDNDVFMADVSGDPQEKINLVVTKDGLTSGQINSIKSYLNHV